MNLYRINYTQTEYGHGYVEAETEEEALRLANENGLDDQEGDDWNNYEIQEGTIECEEEDIHRENYQVIGTYGSSPLPPLEPLQPLRPPINDNAESWCLKCGKAGVFENDICEECKGRKDK